MSRVAVTGVGVVSPLGTGKEAFWQGLVGGRSATKHLSAVKSCSLYGGFDFASQVVAEVEDFDPERLGVPPEVRKLDRFIQFAVAGALQAVDDAALDPGSIDRDRLGVALSTAICGTRQMESEFLDVTDQGRSGVDPAKAGADLYLASRPT